MNVYDMHAIVKGHVQNVGFRATTLYYARQLGLKGTVCNLSDGNVEINAQGTKESLEKLLYALKQESGLGYIEDIELEFSEASKTYNDFSIQHSKT